MPGVRRTQGDLVHYILVLHIPAGFKLHLYDIQQGTCTPATAPLSVYKCFILHRFCYRLHSAVYLL